MRANRRLRATAFLCVAIAAAGCAATAPQPPASALRAAAPPSQDVPNDPRQAFAAGYEAFHRHDYSRALDCMTVAADHDFELQDYALYYLAISDSYSNLPDQAQAALRRLLDTYPQSVWTERAELELARLELGANQAADASARASRILGATRDTEVEQQARLLLAQALERSGDPRGAYEQLETLRNRYPRGDQDAIAREMERALLASNPGIVDVDTLEYRRGEAELLLREGQAAGALAQIDAALRLAPPAELAELKVIEARAAAHIDPTRARRALLDYLALAPRGPAAPAVLDRLARIDWNADQTSSARDYFRRLVGEFPSSLEAPEAMFAIGRTFEDDRDLDSARAQYERTYARYPGSTVAFEARFRAAFTLYMDGAYQSAARRFGAIGERIADGSERDMTLYWRARALEKSGDADHAHAIYQRLAISIDSNYYPALASDRVGERPAVPFPAASAPDPARAPPQVAAGDVSFHLTRVMALRALDLAELQPAELSVLEAHAREIPALRGFVLAGYQSAGAWHRAIAAAVRMEERGEISREVAERLRYPRAYPTLIDAAAARRGLDRFLLLALIRQESLFDPRAVSSSDARGLMQLLPATARRVADGRPLQLFDPADNVDIGSSYLKQLLDLFDGDRFKAVAAYNAGEHAVARWNTKFPGDDDQWVENIGYHETRDYVKKVLGGVREYELIYQSQSPAP